MTPIMINPVLLSLMQHEVWTQTKYALHAAAEIEGVRTYANAPLPEMPHLIDYPEEKHREVADKRARLINEENKKYLEATETFWRAMQQLLVSVANISKLLWGQKRRFEKERRALRASLRIADNSPLAQTAMRNNFEHVDERLDVWDRESTTRWFFDMQLVPGGRLTDPPPNKIDTFRNFDTRTGTLTFWGDIFNVPDIVEALRALEPIAAREASKSHWPHPPPNSSGGGQ